MTAPSVLWLMKLALQELCMLEFMFLPNSILWCSLNSPLQNKFSCRSRAWMEVPLDAAGRPCARIRMDHTVSPGVIVNRTSFKDWCKDYMEIKVNDLHLDLNMSTVTGLAELVEDEVIPQPLLMQVSFLCTAIAVIISSDWITRKHLYNYICPQKPSILFNP